ncbi:hypothetical protein OS175_02720 [Marinicella sp. S1101]|uniref:hypothetical protein n=1 Tax=Marinicella marina TaxID=2996016 RepID=UPI002260F807|nr:hypothetical protein [Marinicella marina]MCX7552780.1 hypothetical protein [Marinicella marina]MDJ1139911.1 hypothetical protein [Marinicella marina]
MIIQSIKIKSMVLPLVVCWLLSGCSSAPELDKQTRILNTLKTMETLIEAKALDDFMDFVSDDFALVSRGYNKKDAERLLRIRLMRNKNIHVHQVTKNLTWTDGGDSQVEVTVVAAVAGSDISLTDLPTFRGEMAKFKVNFELIDGEYLITEATWERATPADFVL